MHLRRFACFCLGLWLAGSLMIALVRQETLASVDRVLARGRATAAGRLSLQAAGTPTILRYHASEQNRWYLAKWVDAQLILGVLFFLLMLFGSRENKFLLGGIGLMLLLATVQKFLVVPDLIALGRN